MGWDGIGRVTCDDLVCFVEVGFQGFQGLGEIVRLGLGSCCWVVVIAVVAGQHGGCGKSGTRTGGKRERSIGSIVERIWIEHEWRCLRRLQHSRQGSSDEGSPRCWIRSIIQDCADISRSDEESKRVIGTG